MLDPVIAGANRVTISQYDATDQEKTKEWVEKTIKIFKTIDSIIICAGVFYSTPLLFKDYQEKEIEEL